jgi:repressor LexA
MPKVTSNEGKPFAEIGTLIRNLRLRRGLSQFDLASSADINNSYLSRIENGERRPSPKILKKYSEILQYPYDELVVASGILSEDFVKSTTHMPPQIKTEETTSALQQLIQVVQGTPAQPVSTEQPRRGVPVYDSVPAGVLTDANVVEAYGDMEQIVLSEEELNFDPRAFALVVQGDSMIEAGILDGDVLIVSPNTPVGQGEIGVVLVNKRSTSVKMIYTEENRVILQAANSSYRPQVLTYPDEIEILGKVTLVRRKIL